MSDIIKFPEVSEERKRAIHMSMSYAYSRLEQSQLRFDLPEMINNKAVARAKISRPITIVGYVFTFTSVIGILFGLVCLA